MHVQSVQKYCFSLSNIQMCGVLVDVVVLVAKPPTVRAITQDHVFTTAILLGSSTVFESLFENSFQSVQISVDLTFRSIFFARKKNSRSYLAVDRVSLNETVENHQFLHE